MKTHQNTSFGNMGGTHINQKATGPSADPSYIFNTMVFEMSNNWPYVNRLLEKFHNKTLKRVDHIENEWLNFIMDNNIDITKYTTPEEFIDGLYKKTKENESQK